MPDRPAAQIPGLQVLGELGRGARSVAFRARRGDFVVALKFPVAGRSDPAAARQFRREAVALASVAHPCLPQVFEVGEVDGLPYVIRELAEGRSLASELAEGPLPEAEVAALGRQLAQALAAIHRRRIVHREVAPHNVLRIDADLVKLIDFGTPRGGGGPHAALGYHAPEQTGLVGRSIDGRADLYALGALLFHAASGRPPFIAPDAAELLRLHAVEPAPALASVRPQCSPVLAGVIARLLAKDPDDRYQTGEAVAAALAPLLGLVPEAVPEDRPATALVGRGPELQQLTQAWQQTRRTAERLASGAGALPVVVAMEGEAGAGKSRLVAEFVARVAGPSAAVVLRSRCSDDGLPFAAVREALDGVALRASADTAVARELAARLRGALAELAGLLRGLSPGLAALVAGPPPGEDTKLTREQVDGAVVDWLARLTATGGLIWIVDDLQWIDEGSLRLLGRFAARPLEGPALLLCCVRGETGGERVGSGPLPAAGGGSGPSPAARAGSGPMPAALGAELDAPRPRERARSGPVDGPEGRGWPGSGPLGRRSGPRPAARGRGAWARYAEVLPASLHLWLGPLPSVAVGQLMAGLLGGRRIPPELVELVARRSDGMPLAVLELVRAMLDEGVLTPSWDVWVADPTALAGLPLGGDALRLISGRIAHLSERTGEVLRLAAVCGDRFALPVLARAGAMAAAEVEMAVDEADAAGLVERGRAGHNFVHHRVREALLAALTVEQRQALHQAVAAALGAREVYARAHHYLSGTLRDPEPVRAACVAAGLLALREAADEDAHRFLSRAQGLPGAEDPAAVDGLAEACLRTGRLVEAEQHVDRGLVTAHEPWRRSGLLRQRARAAQLRRDHARALATMATAFAALGERLPGHRPIDAVASGWWWLLAMVVGATGVGRGTLRGPARAHAVLVAECLAEAYVMAYLAFDRRTMIQAVLRHYYIAERLGEGPELALAYCNYATLLVSIGHRARGLAHARAAEALGQRLGQPTLARVHERLMVVYEFAGEPRMCEAIGRQIHPHERRWLDTRGQSATGEVLGFNLWLRGRDEAALAAVQPLIQELAARGPGVAGQQAQVLLQVIAGLAQTALGRLGEADACFDAAARGFASAPEDRYQNAVLLTCAVVRAVEQGTLGGPLEDAIGRHAQLDLGERRVPFYGRFFYPFVAFARLMQALGSDARARPTALERLVQAIAEAERRPPHPLHRGFVLLARAGLQWMRGDPGAALDTLGEAEDLALKTDNHWLRFEVLRQQAHALRAAGHGESAEREARLALALAEQQAWPLRAMALRREFELRSEQAGRGDISALKLRRHLDALLALSLASARARGFDDQARAAIEELTRILPAERTALFLGGEGEPLVMVAGRDAQGRELPADLEVDRAVLEQVRDSQAPVLARGDRDRRSVLAAPLLLKDALIGIVYLDNRTIRGAFTGDDVEILQAVAGHLAIALETARTTQLEAQIVASVHEKSVLIEHATSAVGIGIAVLQADGRLAQVSPTLREMTRAWPSAEGWWQEAARQLLLPEPTPCPRCGEQQNLGRSVADLRTGSERQVFEVTFTGHFHEFTRAEAGHVLLVSDITRRKISEENLLRLNEELTHTRDEALAASRAKSTFLANMSHELRTPLNAIIGFAEMLVEDAEHLGARHMVADLGKIRMSGTHLLELISTILDLSKVETGRMELEILEFSLVGMVDRVAAMLTPMVAKNRNMLSHTVAAGVDLMIGDETKVKQILFNLLSNAAKFTRDGVVKLDAEPLHEDGRDWVVCTVSDTGIGFRADQIDKLFQDFYQADMSTTRKYGGTGLGLAIVHRFCGLMEGGVTVTSEPGIGSSFRVKLPRVLNKPPRLPEP